MTRRTFDLAVDWLLVVAGALAFGTGLALLLGFHVDHGGGRVELAGLGKDAWLDLHRDAAIATAAVAIAHIATHLRALAARVRRSLRARPDRRTVRELLLYVAFPAMVITGFVAWLALGDAPGPAEPTPPFDPHDPHHMTIDLHNVSAVLALAVAVLHVKARWRSLVRRRRVARERCPARGERADVRL